MNHQSIRMAGSKAFTLAALAALAVLALVACLPAGTVHAGSGGVQSDPNVMPPQAKPFGHSYGDWSNKWWQWAFSLPVVPGHEQDNPLFDTTGASCGAGQSGPVFYLAGIFTIVPSNKSAVDPPVRNCTVSAGKGIFFPILNAEFDNADGVQRTLPELRQLLAANMADVHDLSASIDGVPVSHLSDYVIGYGNSVSSFTVPNNNLYQYYGQNTPAGTYSPMVTDGYYLMLHPMSVGRHTVHFAGAAGDYFALDITYNLTIVP